MEKYSEKWGLGQKQLQSMIEAGLPKGGQHSMDNSNGRHIDASFKTAYNDVSPSKISQVSMGDNKTKNIEMKSSKSQPKLL